MDTMVTGSRTELGGWKKGVRKGRTELSSEDTECGMKGCEITHSGWG